MKKNLKTGILTILITFAISLIASPITRAILPGGHFIQEPLHSALEIMGAFAALSLSGLILFQSRYRKRLQISFYNPGQELRQFI